MKCLQWMTLAHEGWVMVLFGLLILVMLALDLGLVNRKTHVVSNKEAILWSLIWIGLSMGFSGFLWWISPPAVAMDVLVEFQTAYWIEKALSVDNLFVFILVFQYFNVPSEYHHKVLFWGILGAIVMRALFIFTGTELIGMTYFPEFTVGEHRFRVNGLLTVFGLFLVFAGVKSAFVPSEDDGEKDFSKSPGAKVIYLFFRVSKEYHGDRFFTRENGMRLATPLLVVVGVVEFTDLLFAVDSIPAIFAVSDQPLILYTSNIFAILGLRSLYFLLANFVDRFRYLKYGLAFILTFIGVKMVLAPVVHVPSALSLGLVLSVLLFSSLVSILIPEKGNP